MAPNLELLIEKARKYVMTAQEREEQIRSFAYGNVHLHNSAITRADVDRAADSLRQRPTFEGAD